MKVRLTYLEIAAISLMGIYSIETQGLQTDFDQETEVGITSFAITDVMILLGDGARLQGRLLHKARSSIAQ